LLALQLLVDGKYAEERLATHRFVDGALVRGIYFEGICDAIRGDFDVLGIVRGQSTVLE
jgi:hypothetical protein